MDVVVVGSCNTDLVSFAPRFPQPGETIHGSRFVVNCGGKGANQCVVASRLGATTAMVAKLGEDSFGYDYLKNLKKNKVNTDHVKFTKEASTGVAIINVNEEGQNGIVIVSGSNLLLSEADVAAAEDMIKSCKVLVCQLEISAATTLSALKMARKHSVPTILNPAPAQAELDPEVYGLCDIFCPNETETEILTGSKVTCVEDAKQATDILLDRGCKTVIITLGAEGSVFATKENRTPQHIPATKVKPVDTTGAGDAFIGSLAYFYSHRPDLPLAEAIRRSGEVATISVQKEGTQPSYPWKQDLPSQLLE